MKVKFKPFIGEFYHSANPKILILGESHYGNDEGVEKTQNVALRFYGGTKYRFLSGALKILYGDMWTYADIQKISFYNYIQDILPNSRCKIDHTLWEKSANVFLEVINDINPDIILCLGKRLYWNLPAKLITSSQEISSEKYLWCQKAEYVTNNKTIVLYGVHHPSSVGFNGLKYRELLNPHLQNYSK